MFKFNNDLNSRILDKQYLFAYTKGDGFTHRLLKADFAVDYEYNYRLELSAFQHTGITKNNSDQFIENGKLGDKEIEILESLLFSDFNTLKGEYEYENLDITDIGNQCIFINLDKVTKKINIQDGLTIEYFETTAERKLYELNEYFKELIEMKYENWIK